MLSSLQIENVAVIQKANVHFEKGLNVLTGETGAGKSILIDSINAILGNRTSKDLVRTGAAKAVIRAAFDDVPPAVLDSLEKAGYERSEALTLSREITAEGKSTSRHSLSSVHKSGQCLPQHSAAILQFLLASSFFNSFSMASGLPLRFLSTIYLAINAIAPTTGTAV